MTVLQFAPLLLLPLFFGLIRRSRGLGALYNPFDPPAVEHLPSVGLGAASIEPARARAAAARRVRAVRWSLLEIDQPPMVPALCAHRLARRSARISHVALNELLELRDAITRSHSNPPPAPSAS